MFHLHLLSGLITSKKYWAWWKGRTQSWDLETPATPKGPWDFQDPLVPLEPSGTPYTPSNLRDPAGPLEPLGTSRIFVFKSKTPAKSFSK